jgi:hypothetical protein
LEAGLPETYRHEQARIAALNEKGERYALIAAGVAVDLRMSTTAPFASNSGPPELPGLTAASHTTRSYQVLRTAADLSQ